MSGTTAGGPIVEQPSPAKVAAARRAVGLPESASINDVVRTAHGTGVLASASAEDVAAVRGCAHFLAEVLGNDRGKSRQPSATAKPRTTAAAKRTTKTGTVKTPAPTSTSTRRPLTSAQLVDRDRCIGSAVASGVLVEDERALWEGLFEMDPVEAKRVLEMQSPRSAAAAEMAAAAAGSETFRGATVRAGRVFTTAGWVPVSSNPSVESIKAAAAVVDLAPDGPTAQAFRAGLGAADLLPVGTSLLRGRERGVADQARERALGALGIAARGSGAR